MLPEATAEDRGARVTRWLLHGARVRRLHAQRERRRSIGDEVDPQDLDRQQRQGQAQERRQHHDHDLGRVGGQQVAHEAADVGVDAPPLLDRGDDGREVIVLEDHVRGFLGDVGAGDAHGHADVRLAQRRGIVDAVAGHGTDRTLLPPGIDDAQLLLGVGAGVDADVLHASGQLFIRDLGQLGTGDRLAPIVEHAQSHRDRGRGQLVVTGDHHRRDAGRACLTDSHRCRLAWRVGHGHDPHQAEPLLGIFGLVRHDLDAGVREGQHAVAVGRVALGHLAGSIDGRALVAGQQR